MTESIDWGDPDNFVGESYCPDAVTTRRAERLKARSGQPRRYAPWTRHPHWYEHAYPDGSRCLIAYGQRPRPIIG